MLCVLFLGEVDNGGFSQFLANSSGDLTPETIEALKRIDGEYAEVLISATHFFQKVLFPKIVKRETESWMLLMMIHVIK